MNIADIDLRPNEERLRQFGFIALVAFGLLGGLVWWKGGLFGIDFGSNALWVASILWGIGLLAGVSSLLYPPANRPLYVSLVIVTFPIGYVVSHVVMAILFYGVITPVGLLFKILGRDPLNRKADPQAETYWEPHDQVKDKKRYLRQF